MVDADRVLFTARLEVRRAEAQRALDQHQRRHKALHGPRTAARKAVDATAAELAGAAREHEQYAKAEELARRMKHGVQAETDAAIRLDKAAQVLRRYQDALAAATARRVAAEAAVDQSTARAEVLEKARDAAVAAVTSPARRACRGANPTVSAAHRRLPIVAGYPG
jgi:hypothetical protein